MKNLKTQSLTALGFVILMTTVGLWTTPHLIAAVKAALVQNVDEPGRNPYQDTSGCLPAQFCVARFSTVPPGKRLVVTNVSGLYLSPTGSTHNIVYLANQTDLRLYFPTSIQGSQGGSDANIFNQAVKMYFEAGDSPSIAFQDSSSPNTSVLLTGYYINVP